MEKSENEYLLEAFQSYLKELPVVGFNSGRYDLCLIKEPFLTLFHPNIEFTVKKNNNYVCIKSSNLKFLDIVNYIAPGFSYQNFIKAFGVKENKFFFPYEWLNSPDKLDYPDVPPHGSFYSSLKQANITDKEYAFVVSTWQEKNWICKRHAGVLQQLRCSAISGGDRKTIFVLQVQKARFIQRWNDCPRFDSQISLLNRKSWHSFHCYRLSKSRPASASKG